MYDKRILFVCKYNRLRSAFAEGYFNMKNTDQTCIAQSAGVFKGDPIDWGIRNTAALYQVKVKESPEGITAEILRWQNLIVIVADDVPPSIFDDHRIPCRTVIVWNIKDSRKSIPLIAEKVDELIYELSSKKRMHKS